MKMWKLKHGKHKLILPIGTIEIKFNGGAWRAYWNKQTNLKTNSQNVNEVKQNAIKAVGNLILESAKIIDQIEKRNNNN